MVGIDPLSNSERMLKNNPLGIYNDENTIGGDHTSLTVGTSRPPGFIQNNACLVETNLPKPDSWHCLYSFWGRVRPSFLGCYLEDQHTSVTATGLRDFGLKDDHRMFFGGPKGMIQVTVKCCDHPQVIPMGNHCYLEVNYPRSS